jgi:hypothetical protein
MSYISFDNLPNKDFLPAASLVYALSWFYGFSLILYGLSSFLVPPRLVVCLPGPPTRSELCS